MAVGQTIAISDEHRFQAAVNALPVQDNRRLTDICPVERKIPISVLELVPGRNQVAPKISRTQEETPSTDTPAAIRLGVNDRVFAPYFRQLSNQ
jgi:hypothetical protein